MLGDFFPIFSNSDSAVLIVIVGLTYPQAQRTGQVQDQRCVNVKSTKQLLNCRRLRLLGASHVAVSKLAIHKTLLVSYLRQVE